MSSSSPDGGVRVLGVGELLPLAPARRGMPPAPPLDVARTLDEVLAPSPFDFVHVHEPFAPSTASLALRHSRALNVGHVPRAGRARHLHPGRPPLRRALLRPPRRPDGLVRGHAGAAGARVPRALRGDRPGRRARRARAAAEDGAPVHIAFVDHEDRQALRLFVRALRRLPDGAAVARDRLHPRRAAAERAARRAPARPRHRARRGAGRRGGAARHGRRARRRLGRPRARAGAARPRARAPAPCRSPRGCPPTRRSCATARPGCSSSRATSTRCARSSRG